MRYTIAYKDKDGTDFHGEPWLLDLGEVDFEEAYQYAENLTKVLKEITLFDSSNDDKLENITWNYVNEHLIKKF